MRALRWLEFGAGPRISPGRTRLADFIEALPVKDSLHRQAPRTDRLHYGERCSATYPIVAPILDWVTMRQPSYSTASCCSQNSRSCQPLPSADTTDTQPFRSA